MAIFGLCAKVMGVTIPLMPKNRTSDYHRYSASESDHSSSSLPKPSSTIEQKAEMPPSRHVLPKDLDAAIKQLNDEELDRLVSAALDERSRRKGRSSSEAGSPARGEALPGSLPQGKLNAVRSAFKAGVTPTRIAREFGNPKADVRSALTGDARKA
jgi:hypothetical protein